MSFFEKWFEDDGPPFVQNPKWSFKTGRVQYGTADGGTDWRYADQFVQCHGCGAVSDSRNCSCSPEQIAAWLREAAEAADQQRIRHQEWVRVRDERMAAEAAEEQRYKAEAAERDAAEAAERVRRQAEAVARRERNKLRTCDKCGRHPNKGTMAGWAAGKGFHRCPECMGVKPGPWSDLD